MKRRSIGMILLAMVVGLLFIARIPAEAAVRLEPVTETRRESGSQPVVVAADERVFTLFAALNAAGFDHEYPGMSMSPVRRRVRVALIEKDLPSLGRLELFFKRIPDYHLVVWVLQRRDPPGFERAEPGWWVTRRAADFDGLDEALGAFYREADIPALWREVEPAYRAEMERWQPVAEQSLIAVQNYLRTSDLPFRQAVIIPNLLDANYSGNGPQVGEIAYVVAGPTETDLNLSGLVEHELLHSMIGPLLDRHIDRIPAQTSRRLYAVLKKSMPSSYGTWAGALEETLNRAINLRMLADADLRAQQLERLEAQGFLLIKPLDQALAAYEQSGQSFEEYLPILLASLEGVKLTGE